MTEETFSDVVVGCDGSWYSHVAVARATREAAVRGAGLVVLVVAKRPAGRRLSELREAESAAWAQATATAKRAATVARATDPSVRVEMLVVTSPEDQRLGELADRASLLVLGGHGAGGQSAFSLASMSGELVRRFPTPLLIPGAERQPEPPATENTRARVKVGFLPGVDRVDLLRLAAGEAALRETGLEVVVATRTNGHAEVAKTQHAVWEVIHAVPECAAVPLHVVMVEAAPLTALLLGTRPEDLVVVGTRGGGTLAGLIRGSVARDLLDGAPCDVLVIPPDVGTEDVTMGAVSDAVSSPVA